MIKVNLKKTRKGQMIIVSLLMLTVALILIGSLFGRTAQFLRFGRNNIRQEQAINLAEAGTDYAIWQLNEIPLDAYTPPAEGDVITLPPTPPSVGQARIKFLTGSTATLKKLEVTGYVPNTTNPRSKTTIKLDVEKSAVSGIWEVKQGTYKFSQ